jgi:S-DNA-T family DNA segregation ATPase FtsK/SpoIIIE
VLWVGDQDMSKAKPPAWPLHRGSGRVDVFNPVPFATDPRGRNVSIPLFENNMLVGALPGAGKTAALRAVLCAAALDPTCEVRCFELKGNGDLESAEKYATRYACGLDDATIRLVLDNLRELEAEVQRRTAALRKLPRELHPDGKVTRQIANRRSLGLHPLLAMIDECQNLFDHPVFGKEAGDIAERVIKLGRAFGVILILATQRPDKDSLPPGVSSSVSIRFCLRVMGQVENDMILGVSAYKNGIRATSLRPSDRGIGYLVGAADEPVIARTYYLDTPTADRIADRARALRIAAGTLTGHAAGDTPTPEPPAHDLLDDLLSVWPDGEGRVWSETLTKSLAELRPIYRKWGVEQLATVLNAYGIDTDQIGRRVDGKVVNRRGPARADIQTAITERDRMRGGG